MKTHRQAIFATGHRFLESLRWHQNRLWASDFFTKQVLSFDADGSARSVAEIAGGPSGLGFLDDGSVLVVSMADCTVRRIAPDGSISDYADFSSIATGLGNDLVVSPAGHVYVGNFGFSIGAGHPKPSTLAHIDPQGVLTPVVGDLLFPNGMALTAENVLLVAETFAHRISAFDLAADGTPYNHRVWAQLGEPLHPDGITLDADGGVWFGNALSLGDDSGFYRVVEGGEITDVVPVSGAWAVSCEFGGADLATLYMSCNTTTLDDFSVGRSNAVLATATVGRIGVAKEPLMLRRVPTGARPDTNPKDEEW